MATVTTVITTEFDAMIAEAKVRGNHSGFQSFDTITETEQYKKFTQTEREKLANINADGSVGFGNVGTVPALANMTPGYDATKDTRAALQAAIDAAAGQVVFGGDPRVYIPPGFWRVSAPLVAKTGVKVYNVAGSIIEKDFCNSGGPSGSLFVNSSSGYTDASKPNGFCIIGEGKITSRKAVRSTTATTAAGSVDVTVPGANFTTAKDALAVIDITWTGGSYSGVIESVTNTTTVKVRSALGLVNRAGNATVTTTATGGILGIKGDNMHFEGWTTDNWQGARHTVLGGDNNRMVNVKAYGGGGSVNNGGIRIQDGRKNIVYGCHFEAGDDVYQFVPAPNNNGGGLDNKSIYDSVYIACTGKSSHAKLIVIGLQDGGDTGLPDGQVIGMTAEVVGCGFIGVMGYGGVAAMRVQNISSSGPIKDCFVTDCTIDMELGTGSSTDFLLNGHRDTGGIYGMRLTGVVLRNARNVNLEIPRGNIHDTIIDKCSWTRASNSPTTPGGAPTVINTADPVIIIGSGSNTKIINNIIDNLGCNTAPALQIRQGQDDFNPDRMVNTAPAGQPPVMVLSPGGGGSNETGGLPSVKADRVKIRDNTFKNIGNSGEANLGAQGWAISVTVTGVDIVEIDDNYFEPSAAATTARAYYIHPGTSNFRHRGNDMKKLQGTNGAAKFVDASTGAITRDNILV